MNVDDLEFYRELYNIEMQRKEEINNKISTGFTLITILGTIIIFIIRNIIETHL